MTQKTGDKKPILALLLGLIALIVCAVLLQKSLVFSLIFAVIVYLLTYRWSISRAKFSKVERTAESKDQPDGDETDIVAKAPRANSDETHSGQGAPTVVAGETPAPSDVVRPTTLLPGEQELASRKGTWRYTEK